MTAWQSRLQRHSAKCCPDIERAVGTPHTARRGSALQKWPKRVPVPPECGFVHDLSGEDVIPIKRSTRPGIIAIARDEMSVKMRDRVSQNEVVHFYW
jgi:hypothetical protein